MTEECKILKTLSVNVSTDYLVCPAHIPGHAVNLYFKSPFCLAGYGL